MKQYTGTESEFIMGGKRYVADAAEDTDGCEKCAFDGDSGACRESPPCRGDEREDGQSSHFVEVKVTK